MPRRSALVAALLAVYGLSVLAQTRPAPRRAAPPKTAPVKVTAPAAPDLRLSAPKLVVILVVDQHRYDYLTRFPEGFTAGYRRMLEQGAVWTNAHFEHVPTVTAVGHSVISTGAMPAVSGIVGNEWYDRDAGKQTTSVADEGVQTLGNPARKGASPRRLLVSTIGDELKMHGRMPAKVVGISIKDRSAILTAGRMADGAYWYDSDTGNMVSSTWYFPQMPAWARSFNEKRVVDQWKGQTWKTIEGDKPILMLANEPGKAYYSGLGGSAFANDLLVQFAEAAMEGENLGNNGGTDLLAISFSCNDSIGHRVGPDDIAVRDVTVRTDRVIGRLFETLEKRLGMNNVLVVLTADHGVAPMPEVMEKRKMPGGRVAEQKVLDAVTAALNARYGNAKWVLGHSGPAPYLDHALIASKKLSLEEVQQTAAQAVRALPYIARVFSREEMRRGLMPGDFIARRVQNGFFYSRASDLMVLAQPYWLFEDSGTSHGTPYNYDSHVPLVFLGPGIRPGLYHQRASINDLASTLATILGVETPSGSNGRVLSEMFAAR